MAVEAHEKPVPHLRMMVTLSSIILLLVFGDASIDNKVGTPLIGLTIGNPWVVEVFLIVLLSVYMWQFWILSKGEWKFFLGVQKEADRRLQSNEVLYDKIDAMCAHGATKSTAGTSLVIRGVPLSLRWKVRVVDTLPGPEGRKEYEQFTLRSGDFLAWKLASIATWAWDSRTFPTRHLPFGVAAVAIVAGLTKLLMA